MTSPDGRLTVREPGRKAGGKVVALAAEPEGWMHGAHHVVLLVHGYNNDRKEAERAFAFFLDHLPAGPWRAGGYQWPGDADLGPVQWLDFLGYPAEIPDARAAAAELAGYLRELARANPALELTLVGHSLGCRLILEMLDRLRAPRPAIRHVLLMAAAVPVKLVQRGGRLQRAAMHARERLVLYSPDDLVLRFAFPPGQALARVLGHEEEVYAAAVGLHGEPSDFASEPPLEACGNGHGDYWKDRDAADYLARKLGAAVARAPAGRCLPGRDGPQARDLIWRSPGGDG